MCYTMQGYTNICTRLYVFAAQRGDQFGSVCVTVYVSVMCVCMCLSRRWTHNHIYTLLTKSNLLTTLRFDSSKIVSYIDQLLLES